MLKGMLSLEVSICVRSLLRIRYFVPCVLPYVYMSPVVELYGTELS